MKEDLRHIVAEPPAGDARVVARPERVQIGSATLYLGDAQHFLREICAVGRVISDPPYGIGFSGYANHADTPGSDYEGIVAAIPTVPRVILQYPEEMMRYLVLGGWGAPDDVFTWVYNSNLPRQTRLWGFWGCTPDWRAVTQPPKNTVAKVPDRPVRSYDWAEIDLVKGNGAEKTDHPCQLPLALADRIVRLSGFREFCDPFMGSGTLGVAAVALGVRFVGIEKDPDYFDIACHRLEEAHRQPRLFAEPAPRPEQLVLLSGGAPLSRQEHAEPPSGLNQDPSHPLPSPAGETR